MSENINEVINEEVEALEVTETAQNIEVAEAEEAVETEEATVLERDEADLALVRRNELFDKLTTALLVLIMIAPFAILAYIIIWFLNP